MKLHLLLAVASLASIASGLPQVQSAPPRPPANPSPQALEMTYAYDAAGRLIEVIYAGATTVRYAYDPAGNVLSIVTTPLPLTAAPPDESETAAALPRPELGPSGSDESARRARLLALLGPPEKPVATIPPLPFLEAVGAASGVMRYSASSPGLSSSFFR